MKEYLKSLLALYERKNAAYGNSTHITYCMYGEAAYAVRITDKLNRLETLTFDLSIDRNDESIIDTLDDAITYLFIFAGDLMHGSHDYLDEGNIEATKNLFKHFIDRDSRMIENDAYDFFESYMNYMPEVDLTTILFDMYSLGFTCQSLLLFASYLIDLRLKYERRNNV